MGATGSVFNESHLKSLDHEALVKYSIDNDLPQPIIEALKSTQTIDGDLITQTMSILQTNNAHSKPVSASSETTTQPPRTSFELDLHGESLAFLIRWAIDQKIPGYQLFMLKRAWCWSGAWSELSTEGWSFDQVQRAVIACHRRDGFGASSDIEQIRQWLSETKEEPGQGPPLEQAETTGSVAYRIIAPATLPSKLTYRQAFLTNGESQKATHFVSHSWAYPFWSVLEALISHQLGFDRSWIFIESIHTILDILDNLPSDRVHYYWFDLFNKNQHIVTSESTSIELAEGIRQPGKMVFILHPSMNWSISRIWCLYEVLVCMQVEAILEIAFSFEMLDMFDRQQFNDGSVKKRIPWNSFARYSRQLPSVDVMRANATVVSDKAMILAKIQESVGVEEMNRMVKEKLIACFEASTIQLKSSEFPEEEGVEVSIEENEDDDFKVMLDDRDGLLA
jgi:hypothetical protein